MDSNGPMASVPTAVPRIATVGRLGLVVVAILALIAAIIDHSSNAPAIPFLLRLFGAVALIGLSVAALARPMRIFDLGAVGLACLLAGAATIYAFRPVDASIVSLFSWFLLLGFAGLTASSLAFGRPVIDEGFAGQVSNALKGAQGSGHGVAPPVPPPPGHTPPSAQSFPPPAGGGLAPPPPHPGSPPPPDSAPPPPDPADWQPGPTGQEQTVDELDEDDDEPTEIMGTVDDANDGGGVHVEEKIPGWYAQDDGRTARWWDGQRWTDDVQPIPKQ